MRLINTTSSHSELVRNQLRNTDTKLVETYSAGNTDVIFTQAPKHYELLISNKYRAIKDSEIEAIRSPQPDFLFALVYKKSHMTSNLKR